MVVMEAVLKCEESVRSNELFSFPFLFLLLLPTFFPLRPYSSFSFLSCPLIKFCSLSHNVVVFHVSSSSRYLFSFLLIFLLILFHFLHNGTPQSKEEEEEEEETGRGSPCLAPSARVGRPKSHHFTPIFRGSRE